MSRPIKYDWDDMLTKGNRWYFDYALKQTIRASLNQWAKSRGQKVKTKRVYFDGRDSGDRVPMLEVTLLGS